MQVVVEPLEPLRTTVASLAQTVPLATSTTHLAGSLNLKPEPTWFWTPRLHSLAVVGRTVLDDPSVAWSAVAPFPRFSLAKHHTNAFTCSPQCTHYTLYKDKVPHPFSLSPPYQQPFDPHIHFTPYSPVAICVPMFLGPYKIDSGSSSYYYCYCPAQPYLRPLMNPVR